MFYQCHGLASFLMFFDIPNSELRNNHTRSVILSSSFLLMREVRHREIHNLPKIGSLDKNNSIWLLNPRSPNHSTILLFVTFLEEELLIGRQRINPGEWSFREDCPNTYVSFLYFHNSPKMFRRAMVQNNFYITDMYRVYKLEAQIVRPLQGEL